MLLNYVGDIFTYYCSHMFSLRTPYGSLVLQDCFKVRTLCQVLQKLHVLCEHENVVNYGVTDLLAKVVCAYMLT